jgi:hypothetical protein
MTRRNNPTERSDLLRIQPMTAEDFSDVCSLWENTPGMGLNPYDDSEAGIGRYLARNPGNALLPGTKAPRL